MPNWSRKFHTRDINNEGTDTGPRSHRWSEKVPLGPMTETDLLKLSMVSFVELYLCQLHHAYLHKEATAQYGVTQSRAFYIAARLYNSGSVASSGDLGGGIATHCYSSDIANRLTGWVSADHKCYLDG
jgi:hypothetical protein